MNPIDSTLSLNHCPTVFSLSRPQSNNFIYLFVHFCWNIFFFFFFFYGCVGSSFLCQGFLHLRQAGATLHRGARASHCHGLSCCGAQAPDAQAQQLWLTGLVALRHVGSSQTRARTRVPCIGRRILNHCATWEALLEYFKVNSRRHIISLVNTSGFISKQ